MVISANTTLGTKGNSISAHFGASPLTVSSKQETTKECFQRRTLDTLTLTENNAHHSPFSLLGFLDKQVPVQVFFGQDLEKEGKGKEKETLELSPGNLVRGSWRIQNSTSFEGGFLG
jgi:hypothetical protein